MRKIKIILFSLLGMTTIIAAIPAFILSTYNNQDYQQLLIKTVDKLSSYTLSITGPFALNRSFTPALSASGIVLRSKTDDSYVHIDNFRIQITLAPLLNNTLLINDLLLENMQVEIQTSDEAGDFVKWPDYLPTPIIEHAVLTNIQLIFDNADQAQTLDSLMITAKDRHSPLELYGTGQVKGHVFDIKGQFGSLADIFAQDKRYPVNLTVTGKHAQLSINGTIADPDQGKGIDLSGNLNISEIADLFTATPVNGRLQGSFHVIGSFAKPVLAELQIVLADEQSIHLHVTSTVGNELTRELTDLHFSGFIQSAEVLKWILPESSPVFNDFNFEADLSQGSNEYFLKNVIAKLSSDQGLKLFLTGSSKIVEDIQPFRFVDFQITLNSKNTAMVKKYLGNILPEMGPVQGTARITTQGKDFMLSNIDLLAGVDQKTQLTAKGQVGPLSLDPKRDNCEITLDLALQAVHSSELASLLDIEHPEIGPVAIDAHLQGTTDEMKLENITLKAGDANVLSLQANGWMSWDKLDTAHPQQTTDIFVQANSPSFHDAYLLYGIHLPDLGIADASMRIHGKGMVLTGSDLTINIGTENSLLFSMQGKVAQIFIAVPFHKGIELAGTVTGKSTHSLSVLLKNREIPDFGSVTGKFIIKGDTKTLRIPQLALAVGRKNQLMLHASGQIAEIPLQRKAPPRGVNIALAVSAPSSADLSPLVGDKIPDLGRLSIKGQITDHNGILAIEELILTAGNPKQPTISISGTINDVLSNNDLNMEILFDEKTLVKLFDLPTPPKELGGLTGSALLSNADGSFGIEEFKLKSKNSELIDVKINGRIDDIVKVDQISFNADIDIKNPALFGKLFAVDLSGFSPISATGIFQGSKTKASYKGNSNVGKTQFSSNLVLSFIDGKPKISGKISSPNLFLTDFGIVPEAPAPKTPSFKSLRKGRHAKTVNAPLFSHAPIPLQALHKADLNLQLRINKLTGTDYNLDKIKIDLSLVNGKLKIMPANFVFSGGHILMKAGLDAKVKPEWSLNILTDDVQIGEILGQKYRPPPIEGNLDLAVDINGSGASAHEIAASLNGEISYTLEKGKISKRIVDLIFLNPLGWLFSYGITDNEILISCGLANYQIKQGIIRSKVFLIDGPKLMIKGKEEINLARETINALYNLEKKKFFINTHVPIQVRGNLAAPIVEQAHIPSVLSKADRYIFAPAAAIPEEVLGALLDVFDYNKDARRPCSAYLKH
jgi:uncharacterized protein involved in outer membrane biogenesis